MEVRVEGDLMHQYYLALGHSTLFGFQYDTGIQKEHFCICWCDSDLPQDTVTWVRQNSGAESLVHGDYLGHGYLEIHRRDYDNVIHVFNSMLNHGAWFRTRNAANVLFSPDKEGDTFYTLAKMEEKFVAQKEKELREYPHFISVFTRDVFKPWSYFSRRGTDFCARVRALKHKKPACTKQSLNLFLWPRFATIDIHGPGQYLFPIVREQPQTALPLVPASQEQPEEDTCFICMDAKPSTQVFPCGHVVVCNACSRQLANTNDAHTCIKCRRSIERVENL
jgi:hypothetical protein